MRQRKKEEMYPLVKKWESSGQSRVAFSQFHGVPIHTFQYWVRKYQKEQALGSAPISKSKFIPLSVQPLPNHQLELCYPNGVRLQIQGHLNSSYLQELIQLGTHV